MRKLVESRGGLDLVLLGLVTTILQQAETLPVPDGVAELEGSHKSCVNPEDCCKFNRFTEEFNKCCQKKGCCLMNCFQHNKGTDDHILSEYCDEGWECCRFRPQTQEFERCCSAHGCCPFCGQVSRGCCYNGLRYEWGSIVESFPDLCFNLVCAAKVTAATPFFTAVIVPVKLHYCTGEPWCEDCLDYYCVDETKLVRAEGSRWFPDECHECQCSGGTVTCQELEVYCPPRPHSHCVEVPGTCCPLWNCTTGCVDETGQHREVGSSWFSGPCIYHVCTEEEGIVTRIEDCFLTDPIHPSCEKYTPEGECCPQWYCSGCVDTAGNYHESGHEWGTDDPCIVLTCTGGEIKDMYVQCTNLPAPHSGCYEFTPKGECCSKWNCSGCVDSTGAYHPLYDVWKTDPCITHVCSKTGIQTTREECHLGPAPHPSCLKYTPRGECCPQWQCSGCLDKYGKYYELGQELSTSDPCKVFHCTKTGMKTKVVHCQNIHPPHPGCYEFTPEGECCPEWNCSGCVDYSDTHHPVHDVWRSDPCTTHVCTKTGTRTTREECELGPAPHHSCDKVVPPGECCPRWKCSGCFDDYGHYHEVGDKWSTSDPCILLVCIKGRIQLEPVICTETNPPHSGCVQYTPVGECCKKWNCSGCVESDGTHHPLHEAWKTEPCTSHVCTTTGIETTHQDCYHGPPPHPSCQEYVPPGECCSEWRCSGCFDDYGNYHELGHEWIASDACIVFSCTKLGIRLKHIQCEHSPPPQPGCYEYTPEGECCPKWNCSHCVDSAGHSHPLGDVWKSDPCTTNVCTGTGVDTTRENCHLGPPPHPSCVEHTPTGECCPAWECNGCFDDYGNYHELGHEWGTSDPCLFFVCTKGGIQQKQKLCEKTRQPNSGCYEYTPLGECCPKWNCSGCVDSGTYHALYDVWRSDPCTTHQCTRDGIDTTHEDCHLGPAPHPSCRESTPPGDCCSRWECSGCFDDYGTYLELGQEWSTGDPCIVFLCTREGIKIKPIECKEINQPHPGCYEYTPRGECCPKWNCSGCVDEAGIYYPLYHAWKGDPCTSHVCTRTGIQTSNEDCYLGPAPHPTCQKFTPSGECCPEWKCNGCFDKKDVYHELGSEWVSGDPCVILVCYKKGITMKHVQCKDTSPPYPGCIEYSTVGECCPKWNCSGCVDKFGQYHQLHSKWKTGPCISHECRPTGIRTILVKCIDQPHPNCLELPPQSGECCSQWRCGPDCRTVRCGGPPGKDCKPHRPPLACCNSWNCSGCFDDVGNYYPLGKKWQTDPCTTLVCTDLGINVTQEICGYYPPPHPDCVEYTPEGECCPKWNCSIHTGTFSSVDLDVCVDEDGERHETGEKWLDPYDSCFQYECRKRGSLQRYNICA